MGEYVAFPLDATVIWDFLSILGHQDMILFHVSLKNSDILWTPRQFPRRQPVDSGRESDEVGAPPSFKQIGEK